MIQWVVWGLAVWLELAVAVGLLIGRMIWLADRQARRWAGD